jgi:hypothetical protein
MKAKLLEHCAAVIFVTLALIAGLMLVNTFTRRAESREPAAMRAFGDLSFVDFNNPFDLALLKDALDLYYPGSHDRNDSLLNVIVRFKERRFAAKFQDSRESQPLTPARFIGILPLYAKFLLVYVLVMALTWYGVQTIASVRFVYKKGIAASARSSFPDRFRRGMVNAASGAGIFLLFCPAYVIAYAIRTEFNTDTVVFMILLGVVSNGVLVTYANKFYSFLLAESRKGYVDTAIVKNCRSSYRFHGVDGIPVGALLRPLKRFEGHVFDHIFRNATHQYLPTIKEQASFLISGLIIIEMALNIHGHLTYEMLRQLLYKNYSTVVVMILFIFYTVKATEVVADYLMVKAEKRLEGE